MLSLSLVFEKLTDFWWEHCFQEWSLVSDRALCAPRSWRKLKWPRWACSCLHPCLILIIKIGVTLTSFQMSGNIPFSKDELNIIANGFATRPPTSLTTVMGILSGPAAFPILSFFTANCLKFHSFLLWCDSLDTVITWLCSNSHSQVWANWNEIEGKYLTSLAYMRKYVIAECFTLGVCFMI